MAAAHPVGEGSWLAIDFETGSTRGMPCAVGIVEMEDGAGCSTASRSTSDLTVRADLEQRHASLLAEHGLAHLDLHEITSQG